MIYRVIIKVSYNEAFFDFNTAAEACVFATSALEHSVVSEDSKKMAKIRLEIINPTVNDEEED